MAERLYINMIKIYPTLW